MGWYGKIMFGALGLFLGGPLGAIAGAALGHVLVDKGIDAAGRAIDDGRGPRLGHTEQTQAAYFISLFSILGKLSKIDGVVSREEIAAADRFIQGLPMPDSEKMFARQVFNEAKNSRYTIEDFAVQLYQTVGPQPAVLLSFLELLFQIAAADGKFHPAEETALRQIKGIFNVSDRQYEDIKARYFKDVNKYYKALNCTPESSNAEIKASYKKLVKEFHPDVIISKGLPEEFVDFASKRFQEIHESYEKIRQERNF